MIARNTANSSPGELPPVSAEEASHLGIPKAEAEKLEAKAFSEYPGIKASAKENVEEEGIIPPVKNAVNALGEALSAPEKFAMKLAVNVPLLLAGLFLIVYGVMVAVRPRESALSIPMVA